jgi:hypothetical protein
LGRVVFRKIEGPTDAVVQFRIADGNKSWKDQSAAAGSDESLGQCADGTVVGEEDSAAS